MYHRPSQVQLMRGETAPYWAGVVSVRLSAIAERKVSQHSCVWGQCGFDSKSTGYFIRQLELMETICSCSIEPRCIMALILQCLT